MATDASLVTLNAALVTFSALSRGRSSMLGGRRSTLGEGVKDGLSGRIASDASRVTDMVSLRFTISAPLRCSLPGQPRTPEVAPRQDRPPRGARGEQHGRAGASAGGDPGPLCRCCSGCCIMLRHAQTYCSTEGRGLEAVAPDRRGHDHGRALVRRHAVGRGVGEGVAAVHDVACRLAARPGDLYRAAPVAGGE